MSTSNACLQVALDGDTAIVKISGRANFESGVAFKTLVAGLGQQHCRRYLLDLTDCVLMDSTFLGVLSGFGVKFAAAAPPIPIELLNPSPRISDLLENLGVAHLFTTRKAAVSPAAHLDPVASVAEPSRRDLSQTCLDAHRTLMDINPANVPKFKDVARFLEDDLKQLKSGGTN